LRRTLNHEILLPQVKTRGFLHQAKHILHGAGWVRDMTGHTSVIPL
jgi:hypothetical protein